MRKSAIGSRRCSVAAIGVLASKTALLRRNRAKVLDVDCGSGDVARVLLPGKSMLKEAHIDNPVALLDEVYRLALHVIIRKRPAWWPSPPQDRGLGRECVRWRSPALIAG